MTAGDPDWTPWPERLPELKGTPIPICHESPTSSPGASDTSSKVSPGKLSGGDPEQLLMQNLSMSDTEDAGLVAALESREPPSVHEPAPGQGSPGV